MGISSEHRLDTAKSQTHPLLAMPDSNIAEVEVNSWVGAPFTPISHSEHAVWRAFRHVSTKKAAEPNGSSGRVILCADQQVSPFTMICSVCHTHALGEVQHRSTAKTTTKKMKNETGLSE